MNAVPDAAQVICAWCPQPARGDAWHNDGKLHPSCGQIDHGQGWVPPYAPPVAVPDAATEAKADAKIADLVYENVSLKAERDDLATRLSEYLCDSTGGLLSKTGYDVRTMVAHTEEYYDRVHDEERKEVEAERDAALAAIERIRQAVAGHPKCDRYEEDDAISCGWKSAYASVVWALDGAPEPEWEWEYSPGHIDHRIESGAFVQGSVIAPGYVQQYIAEGGEVIKRKVSPWLPVEGESK